ncbi:MAG: T9SS type A sorting domain-containing protein [Bacteroidota bacterium]
MKSGLAFFLFTFSLYVLSAQDYHPLLEKGKTWNVYYWQGSCFANPCFGDQYSLGSDTIIKGVNYKEIIQRSIISMDTFDAPIFYPPFGLSRDSFIIGFMREDTINKKVYTINNDYYSGDKEFLVYDFGLSIKDSLAIPYLDSTFAVLDTIKTIILPSGEKRKMYLFQDSDYLNEPYYIESVGGDGGLFLPFPPVFEFSSKLGCVRQNRIDLYENPNSRWGCETITKTQNLRSQSKVSIFPNPAGDVLNINCKDCKLRSIEIINVNGSLVFKKQLHQSDHQQIDVDYLSSGVYVIRLYDENENYRITKFIK